MGGCITLTAWVRLSLRQKEEKPCVGGCDGTHCLGRDIAQAAEERSGLLSSCPFVFGFFSSSSTQWHERRHCALKGFADCWADIDDSMSSGCDYYCGGKRLSTKKREQISGEEAFNEDKKLKLAEERKASYFVAQDSFLVASPHPS